MKKQEFNKEINSLTELLGSKFTSSLTKRIELDDKFFTEAQQFANETLDFSYYSELERIVNKSKVEGVIKRIDVSQNKNLIELTFPNQKLTRLNLNNNKRLITLNVSNNQLAGLNLDQNSQLEYLNVTDNEITGIWRIEKCSKIKFLNCQNNYLNELRVHKDLRYLLVSSNKNYLQPQKHDKARINPIKNITYITPLEGQGDYADNKSSIPNNQPKISKTQPSWKSFYRWLQTEIIENDNLRVKLKSSQQANYPDVSENALNRFINSLEATLDNDSFFHLFPTCNDNKSFEELFNFDLIFCGKKTDKKKIGGASYGDLKKLFYNWKETLKSSQEETSQREQVSSETEAKKSTTSQATSDKVRNILLIGRTGSGKSTLANVLVNKNEGFEEIFKESAKSVSETKQIQTENFVIDLSNDGKKKVNYLAIDTIGFGDTKLSNKEVLQLLQDLVPIIGNDGLNQILFVTDGRFTEKEIETYKLLETVIFDKEVIDFTTIIRARFPEFEDQEICGEDRKALREENEEMFRILKASRIIYVDNPPLIGRSLTKNKEIREESRKRLLTYLATCQNIYHPANLAEFKQRINDYQTKSEQLEKDLAEKERILQEQEEKFQREVLAAQTKQQIDLELSRRKFDQRIKNTKSGYEWKLKYTQEKLQNEYQTKIQASQQRYNREQTEAESRRQAEIERIKSNYENRRVQVGEAVCSRGHSNVTAYNKYGSRPNQDDFEDTISYVYCSTCGRNDYSPELRNFTTYNFEEWCRMRNQSYANELAQMNQQIQEQERKKQEIITRIQQERKDRDAIFKNELEKQRQTQQQIVNKERMIDEEKAKQQKATNEGRINSTSQERENQLRRELAEMKKEQVEQIRQSKERRDAAKQNLEAFIQQKLK